MQWLFLCLLFGIVKEILLYNTDIVYPKFYEKENIIELDSLVFELHSESDFFLNTQISWIGENGDVLNDKRVVDCDYKSGIVKGFWLVSKIVVSVCNRKEIRGYIQLENELYLIQPLQTTRNQSESFNGAHIVYEGNLFW